jgi:hypothetical protein
MKKTLLITSLLLLFLNLKAQNDPWTDYMMPSHVHTMLEQYVGSFSMIISMSMEKDKDPVIITVNSENSMILGGRFLQIKQQGNMMARIMNQS